MFKKKTIREQDHDIECFVSTTSFSRHNSNKMYYWFKSGKIHKSIGESGGLLLHDKFAKYHKSKALIEKGEFKYGLKNGLWKQWYLNGNLKSQTAWQKGLKQGKTLVYSEDGTLVESGHFCHSKKTGTWVNHILKDTTYYKGEKAYKVKPKKFVKLKELLRKKSPQEKKHLQLQRATKKRNDSLKNAAEKRKREQLKKARANKKRTDSLARVAKKQKSVKTAPKKSKSVKTKTSKPARKPKGAIN